LLNLFREVVSQWLIGSRIARPRWAMHKPPRYETTNKFKTAAVFARLRRGRVQRGLGGANNRSLMTL